jgi:nitrogen regulatory protein P-II 2
MKTVLMKRIVIIGDNTVEYRLLTEIRNLGATGYTCYSVHGRGTRGVRPRHAEPGDTKIEVIAASDVAQKILEHVALHYFNNYAMIAFMDDVEVLRGDKFVATVLHEK